MSPRFGGIPKPGGGVFGFEHERVVGLSPQGWEDDFGCCHIAAVLVVSMQEQAPVHGTTAGVDGSRPGSRGRGRRGGRRRTLRVGGVQGVLVSRGGRWVVDNDSEVRLWEALSGERGARTRLWTLAAVLDAGLAPGRLLSRLNGRLSAIAAVSHPEDVCLVPVADELLGPVAYACACSEDERSWRWLAWALSARLDANLVRGVLPGPGWQSMYHRLRARGFDRETHWISEMPQSFWDRLGAHPERRLRNAAAASDPTARRGVLKDFAHQPDSGLEVWDLVASNPRTPNKALSHLASRFQGSYEWVAWRVAQNRRAGPHLLSQLACGRSWELRSMAASHPAVPVSVLEMLAGDDDSRVRVWVACNSSTPAPTLRQLAADEAVEVREWVARNSSTPKDALEALLRDRYAAARSRAVANPNTPAHLVEALAGDRAVTVRRRVADRTRSREVLITFAGDPNWAARDAVARNAAAPRAVLEHLAKDQCEWVRASVAAHPNTPVGALAALAADADCCTRFFVASNPNTPADLLAVLTADTETVVRCGVAENAAAPTQLLETLAADVDEWVRCDVAKRAAAPSELLEMLAVDESWQVRGRVAENKEASAELLETLAQDAHGWVKGSLCNNASTPERVLDALRADTEYWVRAQAAAAIEKRRELQDTP